MGDMRAIPEKHCSFTEKVLPGCLRNESGIENFNGTFTDTESANILNDQNIKKWEAEIK